MLTAQPALTGLAAGWLALAVPAAARDADAVPDAPAAERLPADPAPAARIMVGPEFVGEGSSRFAVRETVAGSGLSVVFSTTPPRTVGAARATPNGALPDRLPLSFTRLSSGFGMRAHPIEGGQMFHSGVDLAAPAGSPVVATADGTVDVSGWQGGYGMMVEIGHGGGVQTRYAHLSRLAVSAGQQVRQGEVIGYVGSTGRSTGPHLHYEIRVDGAPVNPLR